MNNAFPLPNYTQVPNFIIDNFMSILSNAEFKIIMLIVRYTCGFHRRQAAISFSHFSQKCGLSRECINKSIKKFEQLGWIKVLHGNHEHANIYEIQVSPDDLKPEIDNENDNSNKDNLVNSVDYPSQLSRPPLVNSVDYNKERYINKEETVCIGDGPVAPAKSKNPLPSSIVKKDFTGKDLICKLDEIFTYAVMKKTNWTANEIHDAFKVLINYNSPIRNFISFIKGTINNLKNKNTVKYLNELKQKETQCTISPIYPQKKSQKCNSKSSGKSIMELLYQN